jgi:hypothetical protein
MGGRDLVAAEEKINETADHGFARTARGSVDEHVTKGKGVPHVLPVLVEGFFGILDHKLVCEAACFDVGNQTAARASLKCIDTPFPRFLRGVRRHQNELPPVYAAQKRNLLGALYLADDVCLLRKWSLLGRFVGIGFVAVILLVSV